MNRRKPIWLFQPYGINLLYHIKKGGEIMLPILLAPSGVNPYSYIGFLKWENAKILKELTRDEDIMYQHQPELIPDGTDVVYGIFDKKAYLIEAPKKSRVKSLFNQLFDL